MKYTAGTTVKKGKSETVYGTYPVPQNIVSEVADIRKRFTAEYNKFITPRIDKLREEINQTKGKIKELPQILQVSHMICNIWMFLVGLALIACTNSESAVTGVIGFLIWVIQIVFFIIGKVKDKDKTAKGLYKTLKAQKKELVSLNKQLKK
jgi:steroid 5-alpha reductase family enzyme